MFKQKAINAYLKAAKTLQKKYEALPIEQLRLCVSRGNKKIGRALNVSLAPIITCANCSGCSHFCYDIKACFSYPVVLRSRMMNTVLLRRDRDFYFAQIEAAIQKRTSHKLFRWHVAGDIPDADYLERMVQLAKAHPDFSFWTYTKNYAVVNNFVRSHGGNRTVAIPSNFSIMFSEWRGMEMLNPFSFPEFRVVFKDETPPEGHYCPGNCELCYKSGTGCPFGQTTYCHEH